MSQNRWIAVDEHFFEKGSTFRCRVMLDECHTCNSAIPKVRQGSTSANLKRHLKHHHRQAFDRVEKKDSAFCNYEKNKVAERKRAKYYDKFC